jgi:hypothetical protein
VHAIVPIDEPRMPGSQFTPTFSRLRFEILAALGDHDARDQHASPRAEHA